MRERISAIVAIVLLCALIGASCFYAIQSRFRDLRYLPSEDSPDYIAHNAIVTEFDKTGTPLRRLLASSVRHYSDDRTHATDPRYVTLERTRPQVVATALRGWTDDGGETAYFEGSVKITKSAWQDEPEQRFESERLTVYPDTERFVTDSQVLLVRGDDRTVGVGMDYRHADGTIELGGRVKTTVAPRENNGTQGK